MPTKQTPISSSQAKKLLMQIINKPINKTWRGYATTIFFEIGQYDATEDRREFTLFIDSNWVLKPKTSGSVSDSEASWEQMDKVLQYFEGKVIKDVIISNKSIHVELADHYTILINNYLIDNWALFSLKRKAYLFYNQEKGLVLEKGG